MSQYRWRRYAFWPTLSASLPCLLVQDVMRYIGGARATGSNGSVIDEHSSDSSSQLSLLLSNSRISCGSWQHHFMSVRPAPVSANRMMPTARSNGATNGRRKTPHQSLGLSDSLLRTYPCAKSFPGCVTYSELKNFPSTFSVTPQGPHYILRQWLPKSSTTLFIHQIWRRLSDKNAVR